VTHRDIILEIDGPIARITLNRPDKLNAMRDETADQLRDALSSAESDAAVRAVILTGAGRAFGAGYDLSNVDMSQGDPNLFRVLDMHFNPLIRAMRRSRLPIISAVNGPCAGASVGIALAGDIVIASRSAFFYEPFVGIALVPDAGNTMFLTRIAGRIRAGAAMLLGDRITADQACDWGLVWKVCEDADLMEEAGRLADKLAASSPHALAATKKLVSAASDQSLDTALDQERDLQQDMCLRPEMRSSIEAFLSKHKE
jgi:2-(1,2-epoxy-1,2-dihydrophenyl)acetyl-CoA isomerase